MIYHELFSLFIVLPPSAATSAERVLLNYFKMRTEAGKILKGRIANIRRLIANFVGGRKAGLVVLEDFVDGYILLRICQVISR